MNGPPFNSEREVVTGGGITLMTTDVFVKAAVHRCAELEAENKALRRLRDTVIIDTRVIRRDVKAIRKRVHN